MQFHGFASPQYRHAVHGCDDTADLTVTDQALYPPCYLTTSCDTRRWNQTGTDLWVSGGSWYVAVLQYLLAVQFLNARPKGSPPPFRCDTHQAGDTDLLRGMLSVVGEGDGWCSCGHPLRCRPGHSATLSGQPGPGIGAGIAQ